jgi:Raf kinase inhibitor-like YbhB/YbcL family protein
MKILPSAGLLALSAILLAGCGGPDAIAVTVPDADATGHISRDFACQGAARPLRFRLAGMPAKVHSIAIIMEDLSLPAGPYVHWVAYNAPATTAWLTAERLPDGAAMGLSQLGAPVYVPPCPPSGVHEYRAEVLGLDAPLSFDAPPTAEQVRAAAAGHIVARGETTVLYNPAADEALL